jgi:hypothetical protein
LDQRLPVCAATTPGPHFIPHLLEVLPLVRSQYLLQALIGLLSNLVDTRL